MSDEIEVVDSDETFGFDYALNLLVSGVPVSRVGWEGKFGYLQLCEGSHDFSEGEEKDDLIESVPSTLFDKGDEGTSTRFPHIEMVDSNGLVYPWVLNSIDILSCDWYQVIFETSAG